MSDNRTADVAAIDAVLANIYKAWAVGDADLFVADYTEDATAILPGSYRTSREEIRQAMAASFAGPLKGTTTTDKRLSLRLFGEEAAIVVSESGILFPGETEVPADRVVLATWTLVKRDGKWLAAAYHNCPANPPS
jgi:uncharacterized protein (TIGR02246 family)